MKSYEEHLKSLLDKTPSNLCQKSSAIFPVFHSSNITTKLLFFNYWKVKRDIEHLMCRVFLRDSSGELIQKKWFYVEEIKAYEIDLFKWLGTTYPFSGSIEIQFSSPSNLVFPYPAVVVLYQGSSFSTFVHSAQRLYHDKKDEKTNRRKQIIESGFNIHASDQTFPFLTLINGKEAIKEKKIELTAYNQEQKILKKKLTISCAPLETLYLPLDKWPELIKHLEGQAGCLKGKLFDSHSFPRLIVGNYNKEQKAISVTHTYYDLSQNQAPTDYWKAPDLNWHPLTLMLPLMEDSDHYTHIYFYPIYSKASFFIDVEIYNLQGQILLKKERFALIEPTKSFQYLSFEDLISSLNLSEPLTVRLIAHSTSDESLPARLKIGYNIGKKSKGLSCNICTNFIPANPQLENKSQAFRWAPMMPSSHQGSIWVVNDSPKKEYSQPAHIKCTFYRKQDQKCLSFQKTIPPHGACLITHTENSKEFFQDTIGWCTIKSDNPYITSYYFSKKGDLVIGGDHGF